MDISSLRNISSDIIRGVVKSDNAAATAAQQADGFQDILDKALDNLNTTNAYLSDAENEKLKWALGESENTHDLAIALQKSSIALQYTVAVRDKFLEAYREIMQIQI